MFIWSPGKTVTAWLRSSDSSATFSRHCSFSFPFVLAFTNSLNGKNFSSLEDCKRRLKQLFVQKKFREEEIMKLPEKWQKVGEGNSTPLQYSCLENPMDGGAWWAAVHGVAKSRTRLSDFTFSFHFHTLEKEMATHSSVLAWRIPGTGEPGGLPSMGSHRVGHDWSNLAVAAAAAAAVEQNSEYIVHFLVKMKNVSFFFLT